MLEKLSGEFAGRATILQVDAEEAPLLSGQYEITGVPTLLFFRGGILVGETAGAPPIRMLREKLEEISPLLVPDKK